MHSYFPANSGPYQDTIFPLPEPPNVTMQNGWSQDQAFPADRHIFSVNRQTGVESELYIPVVDFQTFTVTPGNPTLIAYTTHAIRVVENPLRVYISGITGSCSVLNGNYQATVVSQIPGTSGTLSVPINTTGFNCTLGSPNMANEADNCQKCNVRSTMWWFNNSNTIVGGVDAAGSPMDATAIHSEEWWNVVQKNILDPACNCVTLGHAIRTTLSNSYISPRDTWPSVLGHYVTGGHPYEALDAVAEGATTTFTSHAAYGFFLPCSGFTFTIGCTFPIYIFGYTGTWAAANGDWTATVIDTTHFSITLNSTGFPTLPRGGLWANDWMPYGSHIRLKSSFNVAAFCAPTALTDKCPYQKAILNTLQVYGLMILDGTTPADNWDSGMIGSEFNPEQLNDAMLDLRTNASFQNIEQYLEIVDVSGLQIDFRSFTDPTNQIGLSAHNRVTVTASQSGYTPSSIDVQLQGTAVGTDHERISMVSGTTYQINAWLSGNANTALNYSMSPAVTGASVSGTGLITAPPTPLAAVTKTTVTITSAADSTASVYIDVFFIPVSPDGNIRLAMGLQQTSYTDTLGNKWWGQVQSRPQFSTYEIADGVGFSGLYGTWDCSGCPASWSGTTNAQLYAQSTSNMNDTNLTIVLPNGNYNLTLYGEPGYGTTMAGQNVYDVEIQGIVESSYNDGFLLAGALNHGYTSSYTATVSNGILQFNGRIREGSIYGMSLSSLEISPGGPGSSPTQIKNSIVNNAIIH